MYDITIRARVDAAVFPYELKNIELTEMAIESAVGIILEKLFSIVDMKEVTINPSSRERELDLDSLLSQDA
jgi:hypothetical protein